MTPENPTIPGWAQRERQADFAWIQENLTRMFSIRARMFFIRVFRTVAITALKDAGRGARM